MSTMTRPKKKPTPPAAPEMLARGIRMTREYADWLDQLASSERMSVATLIDRAVAAYAKQMGFKVPPDRVP